MSILIQVRLAVSADQTQWQAYLQNHPQALLGHSFAFYEIIPQVFHFQPYYWLAEDQGQVIGIAPFFLRNHLGLGKRLTSMPYLNTGGLLTASASAQAALWTAISTWARENHVQTVELRHRYETLPDFVPRVGRTTSIIPIPDSEDAAWKQLKSVARNRIRQTQEANLIVHHGFEYLDGFWQVYAENMHFLGAPVLPYRWFAALANHAYLHSQMITLEHQGKIIAGMVLVNFKDGCENGWTSSAISARALYCNDLLYWEAIRWSVAQGFKWLDLGRSQTGGGHERFKEKFGAKTIPLPYQELHHTPTGWEAVTQEPEKLYQLFTTNWKRLPQRLATYIGPYFSRQVY